jgi:hypothetical protein
MLDADRLEHIIQAIVIFATAMLGAASGTLFRPEWPALATAGVVSLAVTALLAHRRLA